MQTEKAPEIYDGEKDELSQFWKPNTSYMIDDGEESFNANPLCLIFCVSTYWPKISYDLFANLSVYFHLSYISTYWPVAAFLQLPDTNLLFIFSFHVVISIGFE